MSIENAQEFVKKLKDDPELYKQAASFKTKEERQQWAKGLGYDFTGEELEQVVDGGALTDEELELVAGGKCCGYTCERDYKVCDQSGETTVEGHCTVPVLG
ncbi:MAG TPA: Nif11-like leader peptide family natural product precursor [Pelotomaculum sp.]|nr:Nif11-like leader peptide family natural product precursor [Pelotomaculum sp.]